MNELTKKVIKGLECCLNTGGFEECKENCPYFSKKLGLSVCSENMRRDALSLLKDPNRVKVVRCGNCRYWEPPAKEEVEDGCTYGRCRSTGAGADVNDFCSSGERE